MFKNPQSGASMSPDFHWSPELVWHWGGEQSTDNVPDAKKSMAETEEPKESTGLMNGTLRVFSSQTGDVGVVTSEQTKAKVLYLADDDTRWRLVTTIPDSNSRTVLYASIVVSEDIKVIRVVFPDMTMDWHLERKVWHDPRSIKGISDAMMAPSKLSLPLNGEVWGLSNRMGVAVMTDPDGGVWRTFNGGISWQHSEKERRFSSEITTGITV